MHPTQTEETVTRALILAAREIHTPHVNDYVIIYVSAYVISTPAKNIPGICSLFGKLYFQSLKFYNLNFYKIIFWSLFLKNYSLVLEL